MFALNYITLLLAASVSVLAAPFTNQDQLEALRIRASTTVNPDAVTGTTCLDTKA